MDTALLLVIILIVVLIWRGPRTLPQLGAMLGRGVKQARSQMASSKGDKADAAAPVDHDRPA